MIKTVIELENPPVCDTCGIPFVAKKKWNSGNPAFMWLDDCNCADEQIDEDFKEWIRKYRARNPGK